MRTTPLLLIGVVLFAAAVWSPPSVGAAVEERRLGPPPPVGVLRLATLGRDDTAADLLWLRVVQYVGAPYSETQKYAGIEDWTLRIGELSPRFELPYLVGGILLATWPDRAAAADRILARGEEIMPDRFTFPLQRGFVAYFGALDWAAAAAHYERASKLPGSPPYLPSFVARLKENASTCATLRKDLETVVRATTDERQSDAMKRGAADILVNCTKAELDAKASSFKLTHLRSAAGVQELLDAGLLAEPPWAPRGTCWHLEADRAKLVPCP